MNIQERIEALETEFADKIKALKAEAQRGDEFPKHGDKYHYIEATGRIDWFQWDESSFGLRAQDIGNIYKTDEEAQFAVEKLKVEAELRKYSKPFELDSFNHYIFLDTDSDCLDVDCLSYCQSQGTIHFESEEKARQAIKSVGEERIKRYIFGVEG